MQLFLLFQAPGDLEIEFKSYYASRFLIIFLILNFRLFFFNGILYSPIFQAFNSFP